MKFAVSGKGGTGKTTFVANFILALVSKKQIPVLAVDADPNSNLGEVLGLSYNTTIADVCEDIRHEKNIPSGISKIEFVNFKLREIIQESEGLDLLVMGRPEGRECYCYINELLRNFMLGVSKEYKHTVIDNEAGMEHMSRRTTDKIDVLFVVCEPTFVSLRSAIRIKELTKEIKLTVNKIYLVLNKIGEKIEKNIMDEISNTGIEIFCNLAYDKLTMETSEKGLSLTSIIDSSIFFPKIKEAIENKLFL